MTKHGMVIVLMVLFSLLHAQKRPSMIVLDVQCDGLTPERRQILSDKLRSELGNSGEFVVWERGEMSKILLPRGIRQQECVTVACAVKAAQAVRAELAILWTMERTATGFAIGADVLDASTSQVVRHVEEVVEGSVADLLMSGIPAVALKAAGMEGAGKGGASRETTRFADMVAGGKYSVDLATGAVLEGVVELKTDTSVIIETSDGPFLFHRRLVVSAVMLAPPEAPATARTERRDVGIAESEIMTYDELLRRGTGVGMVEVRIKNGAVYRGLVAAVDSEMVRVDIEGSEIPISREIVDQIATVVPEPPKEPEVAKAVEPRGPFDTVYVTSTETDEYGRPGPPLLIVGEIQKDDFGGITIVTPNGVARTFKRNRIARVDRHTATNFEEEIKKYAQSLFCPADMMLVDLPPGKEDRPFFKVCVDKYEYPNQRGTTPQGNVSFDKAKQICETQGKRLCTAEEWQWACGGLEGYSYPYGHHFDDSRCNTRGTERVEPSGMRGKCIGKFGLFDMVGNIFEWVVGTDGKPMLMGGPYSKCQTVSPGMTGEAKPQIGLRCCRSN